FKLFQTVPLSPSATGNDGVNLVRDTVDGALWVALLKRSGDREFSLDDVRNAIQNRTVNFGLVPKLSDPRPVLPPIRTARSEAARTVPLRFEIPAGGS